MLSSNTFESFARVEFNTRYYPRVTAIRTREPFWNDSTYTVTSSRQRSVTSSGFASTPTTGFAVRTKENWYTYFRSVAAKATALR